MKRGIQLSGFNSPLEIRKDPVPSDYMKCCVCGELAPYRISQFGGGYKKYCSLHFNKIVNEEKGYVRVSND